MVKSIEEVKQVLIEESKKLNADRTTLMLKLMDMAEKDGSSAIPTELVEFVLHLPLEVNII